MTEKKEILKITDEYKRAKKLGTLPYTDLIIEKEYPIGWITINRPEKYNTLTTFPGGTCDQLSQAYHEMAEDPEIRVFILKGAGDVFCAGFDLSGGGFPEREKGWAKGLEMHPWTRLSRSFPDNPESSFDITRWWNDLWENPKPSIALVDSFCVGAGLWNINLFDIVYATPEAIFAYPPIRYGCSIVPQILPTWMMGFRRTMDMVLTGRHINAQEAYDSGLITKIVPKDKLVEEGRKMADSIARVPPMTNYFSKLTVHQFYDQLGVKEWARFGIITCYMKEHSHLPGDLLWLQKQIDEKGFNEANREMRERFGMFDEERERERVRLKTLKTTRTSG